MDLIGRLHPIAAHLVSPGAFSRPMGVVAPGPYHCSIHPPMVGTIDK
jgi:hypothetical protein